MAKDMITEGVNHAPTPAEYILHHLGHLSTKHQESIIDLTVLNIDTVFWSVLMGIIALTLMVAAARRATSGVPGRFQAAVEMVFEMVNEQAKNIVHGDRTFIAPLALTVFVWVLLMNSLDFLPVDLFAAIFRLFDAEPHFRIVPTADLNCSLGMAIGVLFLMLYYNLKIKGLGGFIHELFCAPFGSNFLLWPFNILFNLIEYLSKPLSHSLRLFGNMYAGEIIFLLLWMWAANSAWNVDHYAGLLISMLLALGWAIFHILIVALQAYVFMMLTVVYIAMAHEHH